MSDDENIYKTRETLLQKLKNKHDDSAWEDFVFFYQKYIYYICRRMNLSHHDSEEIVQKVLMIAWRKLPNFDYDKRRTFRGWLCKVTKDCVKEFYRSYKSQSNKIEKASNQPKDSYSLPEIEAIAEEEWKTHISNIALDNIKDNITDKAIDVFLKLSEGKPRPVVAEETGLPPNTVSVYKKRVTAMMVKEIARLHEELGDLRAPQK